MEDELSEQGDSSRADLLSKLLNIFFFVADDTDQKAKVQLVPGKFLQPSLMFQSKAGAYLNGDSLY
jgi:hypothetical protein